MAAGRVAKAAAGADKEEAEREARRWMEVRHMPIDVGERPLLPRQHTSAYVSIRQYTSQYVRIRQNTSAYISIHQHTSAHVSTRQHTSA